MSQAARRRIGGITLLATWQLQDVKVDPYCATWQGASGKNARCMKAPADAPQLCRPSCSQGHAFAQVDSTLHEVICRFQIRIARTSRLPAGYSSLLEVFHAVFTLLIMRHRDGSNLVKLILKRAQCGLAEATGSGLCAWASILKCTHCDEVSKQFGKKPSRSSACLRRRRPCPKTLLCCASLKAAGYPLAHVLACRGLQICRPCTRVCCDPGQVQKQYCAFLSDYLQYGEEYIVSVRAGSVDNWSFSLSLQGVRQRSSSQQSFYCWSLSLCRGASGAPPPSRCASRQARGTSS